MRFSQNEKYDIINLVESSSVGVKRTLKEFGINRSTFYNWYDRYLTDGYDGLAPPKRKNNQVWNRIPNEEKNKVVEIALDHNELSSRELAYFITDKEKWFISESSVYRILKERGLILSPAYILLKASDSFRDKTVRPNQMWQTDFTYFKILGWGWYYLSTILDDYSRYIIAWDLCTSMTAPDVQQTVIKALQSTGISQKNCPKLLSDNGPCYISNEFRNFLKQQNIQQINGKPNHPQTQGKIERYHRSMKNVINLENYYFPEELERKLTEFINYYNNQRYHESLNNVTPADVFFGRDQQILQQRKLIKAKTLNERRNINMKKSKSVLILT
jgi:transposase InsO family protein